jgi:hypothetical protein
MAKNIRMKASRIIARRVGPPTEIDSALPELIKGPIALIFKVIGDYALTLGDSVSETLHDIGNELNRDAAKGDRIFDPVSMLLQAVSKVFATGAVEYNVSLSCMFVCMYVCMHVCCNGD